MGTIQMDFRSRELKLGFKDRERFDAEAVKRSLRAENFADVELLSEP
jgi:hypothetical protein